MKAFRLFVLCAAAFLFVAAPIYMNPTTYPVFINGQKFANAQNINGIIAVSVEDLQKVFGGGIHVNGNHLSLVPAVQASAATGGGGAGKVKLNDFHITHKIDTASPIFIQAGKAYVRLSDVAHLFGGTFNAPAGGTLRAGQAIQLNFANSPGAALSCFPPIGTSR